MRAGFESHALLLSHVHGVRKKIAIWRLIITLEKFGKYGPIFKFFHQLICEKILYVHIQTIPPHLQYVATLPCESRKYKNVTDFDSILNKLLTCSWGYYEHLI